MEYDFDNEMRNWEDKRFSFFADPQKGKNECRPTFGTLHFARHTSRRFAKCKEPNFPDARYCLDGLFY